MKVGNMKPSSIAVKTISSATNSQQKLMTFLKNTWPHKHEVEPKAPDKKATFFTKEKSPT